MGFFDNISKTISDAGQTTIQKGKDMADTAKLNSQISEEEKKIAGFYQEIGKLYFEAHADEPEECMAEYISQIKESNEKIKSCRDQVNKLKGVQVCASCGSEIPEGALFCSSCGAKVEPIADAEDVTPAQKVCSSCGAVIAEGSKFCTSCGQPVEE